MPATPARPGNGADATGLRGAGLLVVRISVAPGAEDELNAWYDQEHVPEKLGIPGFLSVRRYHEATTPGRYLAVYDLDDVAAADVRVPPTEWTLRIKESWVTVERDVWIARGPTVARPADR
jgi:hypothetical protein